MIPLELNFKFIVILGFHVLEYFVQLLEINLMAQ